MLLTRPYLSCYRAGPARYSTRIVHHMNETERDEQLSRIETKLDGLITAWDKYRPVLEKLIDNPAMRFAMSRRKSSGA